MSESAPSYVPVTSPAATPKLREFGGPPNSGGGPPASGGPPAPGEPPKAEEERSGLRSLVEWAVIIAAALIVALVVKTFLLQAFYIPSGSMEPTLKPGDRVLVNKLSYDLHSIHRGDIVVFKRPPSEAGDPTIKDLIKRVIGLPGERIEGRNGLVYINGVEIKEPYLPAGTVTTSMQPGGFVVPAGQYFVMGDNRSNSKDSRFIGPIPGDLIVGRAFIRVWPVSGIGLL